MNIRRFGYVLPLVLAACASAQLFDPSWLLKPPPDTWPTFHGDYTGRRYSSLDQINQSTIRNLRPAWIRRFRMGDTPGSIVGGEATEQEAAQFGAPSEYGAQIKSSALLVRGILYFSAPDNAWAVDAR